MWPFWSIARAEPVTGDPGRPAPIVNGSVEEGYPATVGLAFGPWVLCSGSLIAPRVVLTAAHCVVDFPSETFAANGSVLVGTRSSAPTAILGIAEVRAHPGYVPISGFGQSVPENDVGVVILQNDAPETVRPVWFRTEPLTRRAALDELVTSVGYGLDETGRAGTKRSAPLVVSEIDDAFLVSLNADNQNSANICSGDSGGPQYHEEEDGRLVQWAVHSWGDQNCAIESGSTRVDAQADWILAQVESVHGTTDACELTGSYDDGVCDATCEQLDPDCWLSWSDIVEMGSPDPGGCSTVPGLRGIGGAWIAATVARRRRSVTPR